MLSVRDMLAVALLNAMGVGFFAASIIMGEGWGAWVGLVLTLAASTINAYYVRRELPADVHPDTI